MVYLEEGYPFLHHSVIKSVLVNCTDNIHVRAVKLYRLASLYGKININEFINTNPNKSDYFIIKVDQLLYLILLIK
jgi:hypothetical protein